MTLTKALMIERRRMVVMVMVITEEGGGQMQKCPSHGWLVGGMRGKKVHDGVLIARP